MDSFVARQPIFDKDKHVYAYELLFRTGLENKFPDFDPDSASCNVMMDTFVTHSVKGVTEGKLAFINFSETLLIHDFAFYLPHDQVVVEVLETIPPTPEALAACRRLREKGYLVALDDFVLDANNAAFLDVCDIIKVDYRLTTPAHRQEIIRRIAGKGIKLLAEKVETLDEFHLAQQEGFVYFQGYFFCKPEIIQGRRMPESRLSKMQLIKAINAAEPDFAEVTEAIKHDMSLTYKLLCYINSAAFGLSKEVESIHHAVVFLGVKALRKWVTFLTMAELGEEKTSEILYNALLRARFCELLAPKMGLRPAAEDLFLMGLFSRVDAIMDMPIETILREIPLSQDIKTTLMGQEHQYGYVYEFVQAYERADWAVIEEICAELSLEPDQIPDLYFEALDWTHQALVLAGLASDKPANMKSAA